MRIRCGVLILVLGLGLSVMADSTKTAPDVDWYTRHYPFMSMKDYVFTFETEFDFPDGFQRVDSSEQTDFQNWVANFPLWHQWKPVGIWKGGRAFEADEVSRVVHLPWKGPLYTDVGFPLRILAEYLHYHQREYDFVVVPHAGDTLTYETWLRSKLALTGLGAVKLSPAEARDSSVWEFFRYLNATMQHSNYRSLAANSDSLAADELAPGDLVIGHDETGRKGAVFVVMMALADDDNRRLYAVATGCSEACDFHIPLVNLDRNFPWIDIERIVSLVSEYPQWGFFRWRSL